MATAPSVACHTLALKIYDCHILSPLASSQRLNLPVSASQCDYTPAQLTSCVLAGTYKQVIDDQVAAQLPMDCLWPG